MSEHTYCEKCDAFMFVGYGHPTICEGCLDNEEEENEVESS